MVGKGKVHNNGAETLHKIPVPANHLIVGVDIVLEDYAHVPIEEEDLNTMQDSLGTHIEWPMNLTHIHA
jgi:hypothetical protein